MASIPYSAVQEQAPIDIGAAVAYADQHGSQAAADYYRVNPRTIRKWRARIERRQHEAASANVRPVAPIESAEPTTSASPNHAPSQASTLAHASRAFRGIARGMTARDGTMWLCPHCQELHHPLPGTSADAWNDHGCYLCANKRMRPTGPTALGPVELCTLSGAAPGPGCTDITLQSDIVSGPPGQAASLEQAAPPPGRHNAIAAPPLRPTQPRHTHSEAAGWSTLANALMSWGQEHPGQRNQLIALATALALIWLGWS